MRFDAAVLTYENCNIFINKKEISFAFHAGELDKCKSHIKYLTHYTTFQEKRIILFNFYRFLNDFYFSRKEDKIESEKAAVIVSLNTFNKTNKNKMKRLFGSLPKRLETEYIGLLCEITPQLCQLETSEINLLDGKLFDYMSAKGMIGLIKAGNGYFLDLQNTIVNNIINIRN